MVGEPGGTDSQEADDVGHVGGPRMKHLFQRCARRVNRDVQHEQCDGDGEHTVAECLHPALAENPARTPCVTISWHSNAFFAVWVATHCKSWPQVIKPKTALRIRPGRTSVQPVQQRAKQVVPRRVSAYGVAEPKNGVSS